jgi:Flp pilus assembly pilin Flp
VRRVASSPHARRKRFWLHEQEGQTVAEYAVLIAAAAVLLVLALLFVGWKVGGVVGDAGGSSSATAPLEPPVAECDPNYGGACLPPYPPDIDCGDLQSLGVQLVTIVGSDPHGLDPDGDGYACN